MLEAARFAGLILVPVLLGMVILSLVKPTIRTRLFFLVAGVICFLMTIVAALQTYWSTITFFVSSILSFVMAKQAKPE